MSKNKKRKFQRKKLKNNLEKVPNITFTNHLDKKNLKKQTIPLFQGKQARKFSKYKSIEITLIQYIKK